METEYQILKIREHPEWRRAAAEWFHGRWGVPLAAYLASMDECVENTGAVPQWYIAESHGEIIGGLGVIENDFHSRKDLAPNVCAVYVEKKCRGRGVAGELLSYVCADMRGRGVDTLYLVTDHTSFYERYGWEFLCMAQGDGESDPVRMYVHR